MIHSPSSEVHAAAWADLSPALLHEIVRLRVDVFVVEQECAYAELDGRDVEPDARQLWVDDPSGSVLGCARVLAETDGSRRVGRVAVRGDARGRGLARLLVDHAVSLSTGHDVVLDAQSHLAGWYARSGFTPTGPEFVEDGIPHLPMRRAQTE